MSEMSMEVTMKQGTVRIVVELEGLSPSKSQMDTIGTAVQAAVVQFMQPNEKDGLLVRPPKLNPSTNELTLRLARVLDGGSM